MYCCSYCYAGDRQQNGNWRDEMVQVAGRTLCRATAIRLALRAAPQLVDELFPQQINELGGSFYAPLVVSIEVLQSAVLLLCGMVVAFLGGARRLAKALFNAGNAGYADYWRGGPDAVLGGFACLAPLGIPLVDRVHDALGRRDHSPVASSGHRGVALPQFVNGGPVGRRAIPSRAPVESLRNVSVTIPRHRKRAWWR